MSAIVHEPWNNSEPPPFPVRRFTVDEYHRLGEAGVLTEDDRVELIEGWIVPKMNRNPQHDWSLHQALTWLQSSLAAQWVVRVQSAITTADSEPEPDLAVVVGPLDRYRTRHPDAADVRLVIEISESSLRYDQTAKARVYANAGISTYWIVNLIDRQIEVYTDPTGPVANPSYRQRIVYAASDSVPLTIGSEQFGSVAVRDLLA